MESSYDSKKGIFCFAGDGDGQFDNDVRASAAFLQDDKHAEIHDFVAAVNSGDVAYAVGELSASQSKAIKVIIKVNLREDFEDTATFFFALTSEFSTEPAKKFTAFAKLDQPQRFENMGECAYLAFHCKTRTKTIRVGLHRITRNKKGTWARWENKMVSDLIDHPQKPIYDFGKPPIKF